MLNGSQGFWSRRSTPEATGIGRVEDVIVRLSAVNGLNKATGQVTAMADEQSAKESGVTDG